MIRQKRRPSAEINVVPYIDVMLVLLVIFMITTPLLTQGVDIDLPKAESRVIDNQSQEPIVVSVDARGRYYLNIASDPYHAKSPEQIASIITYAMAKAEHEHRAMAAVLVKGDRNVEYGKVVQAMVFLQQLGIAKVGLMTDPSHSSSQA